jgi:hypothetical protein
MVSFPVLFVKLVANGEYEYVDGFANCHRDPWTKMKLERGGYLALVYTNWCSTNEDYTLWAYGRKNVNFKTVTSKSNSERSVVFLCQALTKKAMSNNKNWNNFKEPNMAAARYKFESLSTGYGYYIFDNPVPGLTLKATLTKKSTNCDFYYPEDAKGDKYDMTIESGQQKILIYRSTNLPNSVEFSVAFKMSLISQ